MREMIMNKVYAKAFKKVILLGVVLAILSAALLNFLDLRGNQHGIAQAGIPAHQNQMLQPRVHNDLRRFRVLPDVELRQRRRVAHA